MYHLAGIFLNNFRCFNNQTIQFKPITLITGANSSGKSSLLKSLYLLSDNFPKRKFLYYLDFDGDKHKLGTFDNALAWGDNDGIITFAFPISFEHINGLYFLYYSFAKDSTEFKERGRLISFEIKSKDELLLGFYQESSNKSKHIYNYKLVKQQLDFYIRDNEERKEKEEPVSYFDSDFLFDDFVDESNWIGMM